MRQDRKIEILKMATIIEMNAKTLNVSSQGPLSSHVRQIIKNTILYHSQKIKDIINEGLK